MESLAEAIDSGTRDQHSEALVRISLSHVCVCVCDFMNHAEHINVFNNLYDFVRNFKCRSA